MLRSCRLQTRPAHRSRPSWLRRSSRRPQARHRRRGVCNAGKDAASGPRVHPVHGRDWCSDATGFARGVELSAAQAWIPRCIHGDDVAGEALPVVVMTRETDPAALARRSPPMPGSAHSTSAMQTPKKHFMLQCAFCHQQGNEFTRMDRTPEAWSDVIYRDRIRELCVISWRFQRRTRGRCPRSWPRVPKLRDDPHWCPTRPHGHRAVGTTITEWPIGTSCRRPRHAGSSKTVSFTSPTIIQTGCTEINPQTTRSPSTRSRTCRATRPGPAARG